MRKIELAYREKVQKFNKQRAHSRDLSAPWIRRWIANNLNNDEIKKLIVYQSDIKGELIAPKWENIEFILVHNGEK